MGALPLVDTGLDSAPLSPSIEVGKPVLASVPVILDQPSIWSNDRFSNIKTKTCSIMRHSA